MTRVAAAEGCVSGRGVLALSAFRADEQIESCPVIVVPAEEIAALNTTCLYDYYFGWKDGAAAFALGFGSLYNHSREPNADYRKDYAHRTVEIVAVRDIACGEEIVVDYSRGGTNPLWFDER